MQKSAYRWLLQQVRPAGRWLITSMGLGVLSSIILIGQAALLANMIHQLVMENVPREALSGQFMAVIGLLILRGICAWGREHCGFCAGAQVRSDIRQQLLNKLQRLGPVAIAQRPAGAWSAIVVDQVEELQDFISKYLPQMVLVMLVPLIILVVAFPQSWVVGTIFLITAPLIPIFMILVGLKAAEANRRNFQALARLGGFFLDRVQGLETLRVFQRTAFAQQELAGASEDFRIKTMQVLRLAFLSSTVLEFFASVSIALVAVFLGMTFLGYLTFGGSVTLFTGLFLLLLAPDYYQPLRELGTYYHAKAKAVAAAELIIEVLEQPESSTHQGIQPLSSTACDIVAHNLSVNANGVALLKDVSFSIPAGSRAAIIGHSGAGKTTLINTLLGFWDYSGELSVASQALAQTDLAQWRQSIAWLGQHPLIIHGTVFENIAFGREVDEAQCLVALDKAQGMDILDKLPEGLYSILQEQGGNLSVGQAQRIALARAIVVPTKVLILDEPTASLDPHNEALVLQALAHIDVNCTVITITHRMHQLESMDHIVMLQQGRVVAEGKPRGLMASNAAYQQFVQQQRESLDNA